MADTLFEAPSFVCYEMVEVKILKVFSRVSYYYTMGPSQSSEPKQQCWLEHPLKTSLNYLQRKWFIYPTDTDSSALG